MQTKIIITISIIVAILAAIFIIKNENNSYHNSAKYKINYEMATKIFYANLLKDFGAQPTTSKINELAQEHLFIHNAVEEIMFRHNDMEDLYNNIMSDITEWEENYGSRSLAPGN